MHVCMTQDSNCREGNRPVGGNGSRRFTVNGWDYWDYSAVFIMTDLSEMSETEAEWRMLRVCVYTVFVPPCCFFGLLLHDVGNVQWIAAGQTARCTLCVLLGLTGLSLAWAHPAFLSQWTGSMVACVYGMEFVEMYLVNVAVVNRLYIWHGWWSLFKMYVNVVVVSCLYLAMSLESRFIRILLLFLEFLQVEEHSTSRNDL